MSTVNVKLEPFELTRNECLACKAMLMKQARVGNQWACSVGQKWKLKGGGEEKEEARVEQRRPPSESPNLFGLSSWYMSDTKYKFIKKKKGTFFAANDWWIFRVRTQDTHDTHTQEAFRSSFFPLLYLKMSSFWEKTKGPFTVASVTITILFITYSSQIFVIWPFLGAANIHSIFILVPLNFFVLMALINYFLTCKTDPGSVPSRWVMSCSIWAKSYD